MSLKFFADYCVSNSVIQYLRDAGHEVLRLKDHMPTDSPCKGTIYLPTGDDRRSAQKAH